MISFEKKSIILVNLHDHNSSNSFKCLTDTNKFPKITPTTAPPISPCTPLTMQLSDSSDIQTCWRIMSVAAFSLPLLLPLFMLLKFGSNGFYLHTTIITGTPCPCLLLLFNLIFQSDSNEIIFTTINILVNFQSSCNATSFSMIVPPVVSYHSLEYARMCINPQPINKKKLASYPYPLASQVSRRVDTSKSSINRHFKIP